MLKKKAGFSLIELLFVVAIIGMISALSAVTFFSYRERAQIASAEFDMGQMRRLIAHLESDTSLSPGGLGIRPCVVANTGIALQDCQAGILCNDGTFNNDWNGPYGSVLLIDPWDNDYYLHADYNCNAGTNNPAGCAGFSTAVRAIVSGGPNGLIQTDANLAAGKDDIVLVTCQS